MPIEASELLSSMHWLDSINQSNSLPGSNIPAFLIKLWKLVEDPSTDKLISWSPSGSSFIVKSQASFSHEILPLFFKHNNMASFIRQLNMYGFRKIVNIEAGGLRPDKDEMEFAHPYFMKDHEFLLEQIKRKTPCGKDEGKMKLEVLSKIVSEFKNMKMKQEALENKFLGMRKENETLWREIASLREKHVKQQEILNKLIHFLISLVQPNCALGLKRPLSLMLNDANGVPNIKVAKLSKSINRNKTSKDLPKSKYSTHLSGQENSVLKIEGLKSEHDQSITLDALMNKPLLVSTNESLVPSESLTEEQSSLADPLPPKSLIPLDHQIDLDSFSGLLDQSSPLDNHALFEVLHNHKMENIPNSKSPSENQGEENMQYAPSLFELIEEDDQMFQEVNNTSVIPLFEPIDALEHSYEGEDPSLNHQDAKLNTEASKSPEKSSKQVPKAKDSLIAKPKKKRR